MSQSAGQANEPYDVLVVGGGLAGASLAHALRGSGLRIGLVEAVAPGGADQPSYDERTTAISWGSRRLFEDLDLWPAMQREAAPIRRLHVSQQGSFGTTRVHCDDYGVPALGYVLPNRVLGQALFASLADQSQVEVICPARFETLRTRDDAIEITTRDGQATQTLSARLLVGADGGRSAVREALGIGSRVDDYHQKAIVTQLRPGRDHEGQAFERFCPGGPLAVLPSAPDRCAVVWALASDAADRLMAADDETFLAELQAAFGWRLGRLTEPAGRQAYPLLRLLSRHPVAPRAVLVGNAAHNLHPAAAQGFNLTLRDVVLLASLLREGRAAGREAGDAELLRHWADARAADQARVSGFTDGIVRLFSNRLPGVSQARALGLTLLDSLPAIKQGMARRSMGLSMDRANIAQPLPDGQP